MLIAEIRDDRPKTTLPSLDSRNNFTSLHFDLHGCTLKSRSEEHLLEYGIVFPEKELSTLENSMETQSCHRALLLLRGERRELFLLAHWAQELMAMIPV